MKTWGSAEGSCLGRSLQAASDNKEGGGAMKTGKR